LVKTVVTIEVEKKNYLIYLIKNAFEIEVIYIYIYIYILMVFNFNIVDLTTAITSWNK